MTPQLLTYHHHEFPSDLHWQAVSFMRIEWPWIEGGLLRETYGAALHPVHFAIADDGLLLSYAAVIRMQVEHMAETYKMYGLGNVLTYPASRGAGYGVQVVGAATRFIESSDADVAALFCQPSRAGFYARHGWEAMVGGATLTGAGDAPTGRDVLRMMLFVSDKGKAGQQSFRTQPLSVPHGW